MAKAATKDKKGKKDDVVTDKELEELEKLAEGSEDEDGDETEVEPEDDGDDEDDDEDEPKSKKGKKKKDKAAKAKQSRAAANGKIGTQEIVKYINDNDLTDKEVDGRQLRMVLRKHEIEKDEETGRYEWDSVKDPVVKKIIKLVKSGEVESVKQEGLDRLKATKDAKAKTKKSKKDKKKGKKAKAAAEDDDE